ncbi:MAG: DUF4160 domain-containing protein [Acidimicrobiales bacterium]
MPRLAEFYGIVIYMYWKDHAPPHFHAIYGGDEAQIRIEDARVMEGSLPTTANRLVREWAEAHRDELKANWERAQRPEALQPIEPLQ